MATTWYLWARDNDPKTNEYLAKVIGEQNPECLQQDMLCCDRVKRDLYRCPMGYENVRKATSAIPKFNLKLEVYKADPKGKTTDLPTRFDLWKKPVVKVRRISALMHRQR